MRSSARWKHCASFGLRKSWKQDLVITDGKVWAYRTKVKVSFKYEGHQ